MDAETASAIDIALMRFTEHGWFLEQLMELAGLAVADVLDAELLFNQGKEDAEEEERRRILFLCGPGNNGGDGLVAAKHLSLRGLDVDIWHPKLNSCAWGEVRCRGGGVGRTKSSSWVSTTPVKPPDVVFYGMVS